MARQDSDDISNRLSLLEKRLLALLESSKKDLEIAKRLQALVVRNRLPSIPGIELLARHVQGHDVSAESFDIIPTKDFREIFIVAHWSESYGMSSLLLQALIHLQTQATLETHPFLKLEDLFLEIHQALSIHSPTAHFRLSLLRFDTHSLKFELLNTGFLPWFGIINDEWQLIDGNTLDSPTTSALESHPETKPEIYSGILKPGSKIFFLSREWNYKAKNPLDFIAPLEIYKCDKNTSLLNLANTFLQKCEETLHEDESASDITVLGLKIDSKKIHLA